MPVRRVTPDLVDKHPQPEAMRARNHRVEIGKRPEQRVDLRVIRNVVAEIALRRGKHRTKPDRIDAEARHVVEMSGDPGQVAHPVAVAVRKAARIDLIDHRTAPPITERTLTIQHTLLLTKT